jgi:hypothetical protein
MTRVSHGILLYASFGNDLILAQRGLEVKNSLRFEQGSPENKQGVLDRKQKDGCPKSPIKYSETAKYGGLRGYFIPNVAARYYLVLFFGQPPKFFQKSSGYFLPYDESSIKRIAGCAGEKL